MGEENGESHLRTVSSKRHYRETDGGLLGLVGQVGFPIGPRKS